MKIMKKKFKKSPKVYTHRDVEDEKARHSFLKDEALSEDDDWKWKTLSASSGRGGGR